MTNVLRVFSGPGAVTSLVTCIFHKPSATVADLPAVSDRAPKMAIDGPTG